MSKGLFVLRYSSSRGGVEAPTARIIALPGSSVDVFTADQTGSALLYSVGDACMVRATTDSIVAVEVEPQFPGSSTDAHFELERLTQSADPRRGVRPTPTHSDTYSATSPSILAHVARQGDVLVDAEEWVCGPQLPLVIEGLQLVWPDRPDGVDIMLGCVTSDSGHRPSRPVASGVFVGSRGKATQILGLTLTLVGSDADAFELVVDALFLGSRMVRRTGRALEFSSPTGHEPLVGLRLTLVATGEQHRDLAETAKDIVLPPFLTRSRADHALSVMAMSDSRNMDGALSIAAERYPNPVRAHVARPEGTPSEKTTRVRIFRAPLAHPLHNPS